MVGVRLDKCAHCGKEAHMNSVTLRNFSVLAILFSAATAVSGCASDVNEGAGTEDGLGATEDELVGAACGGRRGNTCAANEYCKYPRAAICGRADGQGVCARKPSACYSKKAPVCGCDGATYRNACIAHRSGVSVLSDGPCAPQPAACASDADCTDREVGSNGRVCIATMTPAKVCGTGGVCEWGCKPIEEAACPVGEKQCMMCGAPPPDGICRNFVCVPEKQECLAVP